MQLKNYQLDALAAIDGFLSNLRGAQAKAEEAREWLAKAPPGLALEPPADPAIMAWQAAKAAEITTSTAPWRSLHDGWGGEVSHVCLKMPTGSGKTLIGGHAVGRILTGLERDASGLVLWVVPSDAIFQQTWAQLRDRGHPLRQALDRASGGRTKLIGKADNFTRLDVEDGLTVMLLMLQSAAGKRDDLKFLRESGNYASFYPDADDVPALKRMTAATPNLKTLDLADGAGAGVAVKQSLENTLKLVRPIIILDEGHTAYSPDRRALLGSLNPRFILELTATPDSGHSNILFRVGGQRLRDAQMIKLPVEVAAEANTRWRDTLKAALDKRRELEETALAHPTRDGRVIRPILIVRVERTGSDQRGPDHVHVEDVRDELYNHLGVHPDSGWVKVQTSVQKELGDDLMSETAQTRIIITKDALREGWDCPFAYVLALLGTTKAKTTLTQMIGRVLRQPFATATGVPALDRAYVFSASLKVNDAVTAIKDGLEAEGLEDSKDAVEAPGRPSLVTVARRTAFKPRRIFVPTVTHDDGQGGRRALDFDADILREVDWAALRYDRADTVALGGPGATRAFATIDYREDALGAQQVIEQRLANNIDRPDLARRLLDIVPNPWVGMRIVDETLATLRGRGIADTTIARTRLALVGDMREALGHAVDQSARAVFERKLADGVIALRLIGNACDWAMPQEVRFPMSGTDQYLRRDGDVDLERALFERIKADLNGFERGVALYLDGDDAVAWWWRLTVRGDWGLQGWRRRRVYPDFLIGLEGEGERLLVLETKGKQLEGSDDTRFKQDLFAALEQGYSRPSPGEVELFGESPEEMRFRMVLQDGTRDATLAAALE